MKRLRYAFLSRKSLLILIFLLVVLPIVIVGVRRSMSISSRAYVSGVLNSNFFKNDVTARAILFGTKFTPSDENLIEETPTMGRRLRLTSFEFKLLNAFRQIGYSHLLHTQNLDESLSNAVLHRFQTINNLPTSDDVDADTIRMLDKQLFAREQKDVVDAQKFEPYVLFIPSPRNEPDKSHLAAMYYNFFSALPIETTFEPIVTIDDFRRSLIYSLGRNLGVMMDKDMTRVLTIPETIDVINNRGDFMFCPEVYYVHFSEFLGGSCVSPLPTRARIDIVDDYSHMLLIRHEYGHVQGRSTTVIDGIEQRVDMAFGKISFDMTKTPASNGTMFASDTLLRPQSGMDEFISTYAKTLSAEDFAVSYDSYIAAGRIFRERARQNQYLQQKYEFLKKYIFSGIEFDTGSLESYKKWPNFLSSFPNHAVDYMLLDPDWTWDYRYPRLTTTRAPRQSCVPLPTCVYDPPIVNGRPVRCPLRPLPSGQTYCPRATVTPTNYCRGVDGSRCTITVCGSCTGQSCSKSSCVQKTGVCRKNTCVVR